MWKSIKWALVLIVILSGNVESDEVRVSTINPEIAFDRTKFIDEDIKWETKEPTQTTTDDPAEDGNIKSDVIETEHGPVRGYELKGTNIWQVLDIPYAAFDKKYPFQEPTKPESWKNVREIVEHSSRCPQLDTDDSYTGIPDCLTLSVFMPQDAKNADVLFHIHDGDFIQGSGDPKIYGPEFLVNKNDIILVLPNYRLGPLGFLCMQNNEVPGNAALKDLTMALNWTRENIEAFGGNPMNIVVSGAGTAGALAQYLALAPKSALYVSKVITESGCVLSHWAIDRTPVETADKLIQRLKNSDSKAVRHSDVFNKSSLLEIITAAKGMVFRPCVERDFLTDTPWNLLQDQKLNKHFMLGAADRPGHYRAMEHTEESIIQLNKDFRLFVPNDLAFEQLEEKIDTGKRIKTQYFGNKTITLEHRNELSLCHSDCAYLSPGIRVSRLLVAAGSTVYLYEFSFVSNLGGKETNGISQGAAKGDTLKYVFRREGYELDEDTEEYEIQKLMTNLWVTFIQTGKPTYEGVEWERLKRLNESEETWLSINTKTEMMKGFHHDRLNLWTEIYNEHFIENSSADQAKPYHIPCFVLLVCLTTILYQCE